MTMVRDPVQAQVLAKEILTLLQNEHYESTKKVPKKDGGLRPILDLRQLNAFIKIT